MCHFRVGDLLGSCEVACGLTTGPLWFLSFRQLGLSAEPELHRHQRELPLASFRVCAGMDSAHAALMGLAVAFWISVETM